MQQGHISFDCEVASAATTLFKLVKGYSIMTLQPSEIYIERLRSVTIARLPSDSSAPLIVVSSMGDGCFDVNVNDIHLTVCYSRPRSDYLLSIADEWRRLHAPAHLGESFDALWADRRRGNQVNMSAMRISSNSIDIGPWLDSSQIDQTIKSMNQLNHTMDHHPGGVS